MLAIVHNITAATRLLDVLQLLGHDDRIQTVFTIPGSSAFTEGTDRFLTEHGIRLHEPGTLGDSKIDLVISASFGDELNFRPAPKVVLPHGIGYNKYLNREPGTGNVFGLSAEWLYDKHGDLVADLLVLSHEEQLDRLRRSCPGATHIALVAGDPCLDRMLASAPLRPVYRRAFGVTRGQRLVLVSSTWGEQSLLAQHPETIREMARLPLDEYRVVVALHPNIGAWHSSWQVARWLDDCERAGVTVLPPLEGWRAALVAADLVIGDHGSVPFYGAAIGRPVLLARAPEHTMAPDSAVGRFLRAAPRWKPGQDLAARSDAVIREHDPETLRPVTELASSAVGESASLLRKAFYRLLDLPEPADPAEVRTVPVPTEGIREASAQLVRAELVDDATVEITRYPAELMSVEDALPSGTHLVSDTETPARRMLELAEIMVVPDPADGPALLRALPGCLLATGQSRDGAWEVVTREGHWIRFGGAEAHGRLCASLVHAWLTDGRELADLPSQMLLRHGSRLVELTVRIG
ncbi:hypothetical protein SAMN05421630_112137 [Prauserella marina]|uniref:Uncharacterized protein n=1 Tax=Prauserella marina TaxID=530584 RepID=A0A1G6XM37_9PSEU|nr:hypothetical protein DES30_110101 [Prauserella marina]SDD78505.1 hypothetical protein SAMN05421630_112137 [Prauserella marina]